MQSSLLSFIFSRIEDQKSYLILGFDADDNLVRIDMYDNITGDTRRIPITSTAYGIESYSVQYGPMETL